MRTKPEEFDLFKPEHIRKLSKWDIARAKFVQQSREALKIRKSIRLTIKDELYRKNEIDDFGNWAGLGYSEIVEDMQTKKELEESNSPLMVYKDEKAQIAEIWEWQDVFITKTKKFSYTFWTILALVNGLLLIGYFYQDKLIQKNQRRLDMEAQLMNY